MVDVIDAMATTLAQASVELIRLDDVEIALKGAGYDDTEIARHARQAAEVAASIRRTHDICAGLTGDSDA